MRRQRVPLPHLGLGAEGAAPAVDIVDRVRIHHLRGLVDDGGAHAGAASGPRDRGGFTPAETAADAAIQPVIPPQASAA